MFGIFKRLFRKSEAPAPVAPASNRTSAEAPRAPSATAQRPAPKPQVPKLAAPAPGEDIINIPLAALVKRLPEAMQKDVASPPRATDTLQLPVNFILLQMPRGEIKISFAELRQASPPEIFVESSANDLTDVCLPLDLIVPLLGPKYLNRRSNQKHVAIGEDIGPVFNAPAGITHEKVEIRGLDTIAGNAPEAPTAAPPAPPSPMAAPAARRAEPVIPAKVAEPPSPLQPAPASAPAAPEGPIRFTPPPVEPAKPKPAPSGATPIRPAAPATIKPASLPGAAPRPGPMPGTVSPKPAAPATPPPAATPAPELPKMRLSQPEPAPAPVQAPAPAMPAPAAAASGSTIQAAMWALMIAWPEALRKEIGVKNITQHVVAFPIEEIEHGIKAGKVAFPWTTILAWIQPAVPPGAIAFESAEALNIPLQVVAPLFMAARKPAAAAQKKVQILESIPDVFSGRPQAPEPGATPAAPPPAAAPEPAPEPMAPAAPLPAPLPAALSPTFGGLARPKAAVPTGPLDVATLFGQPNKRSWTPVELVQNTCRLEGVAGAMIAMADGLQVASELPSHMNGDTIAAFLPQIYARVSHYTNEIKLGEPSSISFTTGQQIWQINKAGSVLLLTVGRPGETLPVAHINAVATQLERQSKTN